MSTVIYTGDKNKCRVTNLMECPICRDAFETADGNFAFSATIGDEVLVCPVHKGALTAVDEVHIQNSLRKAIDNSRGHIQQDQKLLKKAVLYEKYERLRAEGKI